MNLRRLFPILLLLFAACSHKIELIDLQTEAEVAVLEDQTSVLFTAQADTASVTVQSDGKWRIEAVNDRASDWLSYSPESGGKGETRVKIEVSANEEVEERSAVLHFRSGKNERTIHIVQKPEKAFVLSSEKAEFGPSGGQFELRLTSNVSYNMSIEDAPWLHQVITKAATDVLVFRVDPNERADKRAGKLVFASELGEETVTVYQSGVEPELILSTNELHLLSEGGQFRVDVSSNFNAEFTVDADWVHEIATKALSTNTFYFLAERNPDYEPRKATLVFRDAARKVSGTVTIHQAQQDAIIIQNAIQVDYKPQTLDLTIGTNVDVTVSVPEEYSWLTPVKTKGLSKETFSFNVEKNHTKQTREADIILTSGDLRQSVRVKQLPTSKKPNNKPELIESFKMTQGISKETGQIPELGEKNEVTGEWDTKTIVKKLLTIDDVIHAVPDKAGKSIYVMQRDSCIFPIVLEWDDEFGDENTESPSPSYSQGRFANRTRGASPNASQRRVTPNGSGKKVLILSPYQSSHRIDGQEEGTMNLNIDFLTKRLNDAGYRDINYKPDEKVTLEHFNGDFWLEHDLVLLRTHGGLWYSNYLKDPITNEFVKDADGNYIGLSGPYTVLCIGESPDISFLDTMEEEVALSLRRFLKNGSVGISVGREWFEATMTNSGTFPNSILILLSCHSFETWDSSLDVAVDAVQDAFHGNISYCGFEGSINRRYATATMHSLVRSLSRGMSVVDAETYLRSDSEWVDRKSVFPPYRPQFRSDTMEDAFLIDPRPRNLRSTVRSNMVTFVWDCDFPSGKYEYLVVFDGVEHPLEPILTRSLSVPMSKTGTFPWSVKVNIYTETKKPELIASYQTEGTPFTIEKTLSLITDKATDIGIKKAIVPAHFQADFSVDIQEQGVVYSSTISYPTLNVGGIGGCVKQIADKKGNPFTTTLTGLEPLTKYYARAYMIVGKERQVYYGNVIDFVTDPIENVVPPEILDQLDDHIPIYGGINPPKVEGQFKLSPCKLVYDSTNGFEVGYVFADLYFQFSNQDMENNTLDYREQQIQNTKVGKGAFISGEGDKFSVFFNTEGVDVYEDYSIPVKTALIISGIKTSSGIKDLNYAFVLVEKGADPKPYIIPEGSYRVIVDGDGISPNTNFFNAPSAAPARAASNKSTLPGMLEIRPRQ